MEYLWNSQMTQIDECQEIVARIWTTIHNFNKEPDSNIKDKEDLTNKQVAKLFQHSKKSFPYKNSMDNWVFSRQSRWYEIDNIIADHQQDHTFLDFARKLKDFIAQHCTSPQEDSDSANEIIKVSYTSINSNTYRIFLSLDCLTQLPVFELPVPGELDGWTRLPPV